MRCKVSRPHLRIRRGASKGGRSRIVPLWWDGGTLRDLTEWKAERLKHGAPPDAPFVGSLRPNRRSLVLSRHTLRRRFKTACLVLGLDRLATLTIHHGRHTFISHALAGGRTLAEVRDAAGHANVSITSAYLHVAVDEGVGELFRAPAPNGTVVTDLTRIEFARPESIRAACAGERPQVDRSARCGQPPRHQP